METKLEKIINRIYIAGGIILLIVVVLTMSSCGTTKMYDIGTGKELGKSRCSGNYVYK